MIAAAAGECNCSLIECEKQLHPVYEWTKLVECWVKHECKDIDLLFKNMHLQELLNKDLENMNKLDERK